MKHYILIYIIVFCHLSCNKRNSVDDKDAIAVSPSESVRSQAEIAQLLASAIGDGNAEAFHKVEAYYLLQSDAESLFYYAFVMAKKHKNASAYFDLYYIMAGSSSRIKTIEELDPSTRDFTLYCLLRSYELNDWRAKNHAEEFFPKEIPKSGSYRQAIFE